jgi:hypothetical protein
MKHREKIILIIIIVNYLFPLIHPIYTNSQTTFKMPTRPYGAVIVDYDLDGDNDLIVGCSSYIDSIVIMFNDGWGNFELIGFEANSGVFIYCKDLTNDGYPDIISRDGDSIFFHENDQNGGLGDEFKICHTIGNRRIGGIADMDTNGYLDIVYYGIQVIQGWGIAYNQDGYNYFDDYFNYSEDYNYTTVGYLNDDDLADVLITERSSPEGAYIMYNNLETFDVEKLSERYWAKTYIYDIDNDNKDEPALFLNSTNYTEESHFFFYDKNDIDEYYLKDSVHLQGSDIESIVDIDLDGYPDITMTVSSWESHPSEDSIFVYRNDQNWGYDFHHKHYIGGWFYPSLISGDLNMDGYPELVTIGYLNPTADHIQLLWNDGTGHFVDTNTVYVHQKEIGFAEQINIYPNPTKSILNIKSNNCYQFQNTLIEIVDIKGRSIMKSNIKSNYTQIDIKKLEQGFYIVKLQTDKSLIIKKFIKQ